VQVAYCRPLKPVSGKRLSYEYNFSPAAARIGDRFIFSSQLPLCQHLIDFYASNPSETKTGSATDEYVLSPPAVAKLIESNTDQLTAQMVQTGTPAIAARMMISTGSRLLGVVEEIRMRGNLNQGSFEADLEFHFP
jgi:hypothetical protein